MRTGRTIDELYDKPDSVRRFLYASIEFELEREMKQYKAMKKVAKRGGR